MSWLTEIQGYTDVQDAGGSALPRRNVLQIGSGLTVVDSGGKTLVTSPGTASVTAGQVLGQPIDGSSGTAVPLTGQQVAALLRGPAPSAVAVARGDRIASDVTIPATATALTVTPTGGTGVVMLHGLAATSGRWLTLSPSAGAYFWIRLNSSVESTAANRITGPGTEYFWFVGPGATVRLWHNGTNWTIQSTERYAGGRLVTDDFLANFGVANRIGQLGWVHNFGAVAKATSGALVRPTQTIAPGVATHGTMVLSDSTTGAKIASGHLYSMRVSMTATALTLGAGTLKFGFGLVQSAAAASLNGTAPTLGTDGVAVINEYTVGGVSPVIVGRATSSATSYTTTAFTPTVAVFVDFQIFRGGASGNEWAVYANGALIGTVTGAPATTVGLIPAVWVDNDNNTQTGSTSVARVEFVMDATSLP